jgi:hypothetical protein
MITIVAGRRHDGDTTPEPLSMPLPRTADDAPPVSAAPPPDHILQFFAWEHLPPHLQDVSIPFSEMARRIVATLPRNPERTVALRKLLEAKDAAVRALVAK